MINEREEQFIQYWEQNRDLLKRPASKLMRGIPVAILFVLPILIVIIAVYIFNPDWYTKVAPMYSGTFTAIFVALFICILFIAYFRMQFKWESNEQMYHELLQKKKR